MGSGTAGTEAGRYVRWVSGGAIASLRFRQFAAGGGEFVGGLIAFLRERFEAGSELTLGVGERGEAAFGLLAVAERGFELLLALAKLAGEILFESLALGGAFRTFGPELRVGFTQGPFEPGHAAFAEREVAFKAFHPLADFIQHAGGPGFGRLSR